MGQMTAATHDAAISVLAERHPAVLADLSAWIRQHPESARLAPSTASPAMAQVGRDLYLFNSHHPADPLARLATLDAEQRLVHIFPDPATLLLFLTRPGAIDCIRHDLWQPVLAIGAWGHLLPWLNTLPPADWPWLLPTRLSDPAALPAAQMLVRQMESALHHRLTEAVRRLAPQYAGRPTPAQVLAEKQRPLRALAVAFEGSAYQQFCARDIADGLTDAGQEGRSLILPAAPPANLLLVEAIAGFDPDLLILNGRQRSAFVPLPAELAVISWDQDYCVSPDTGYARQMGPHDRLMVMVADWQADADLSGIPAGRVHHLNLGVNPRVYHPDSAPARDPEFDLLFVGNIHPFDVYRRIIQFDQFDAPTQRLLLHARERLGDWVRTRADGETFVIPDMEPFLQGCMAELGFAHAGTPRHWRSIIHYFRYRLAHFVLREQFVSALADFRLGLFGRGWEHYPAVAHLARPEIANGEPLRQAIGRAAINLHLHTWTVHHPRLYDTAAAGGFLLVGRVPEQYPLESVFTPGQELDTYGSIPELRRKVREYLDRPDERLAMARRAAERARAQHTMAQRMGLLVAHLAHQETPHAATC